MKLKNVQTPIKIFLFICCMSWHKAYSQNNTINVGFQPWPGFYTVVLAEQLGLFEKKGLNINYKPYDNQEDLESDFKEKKLDIIFLSISDTITLANKVQDLKIIFSTDISLGADAFISPNRLTQKIDNLRIGIHKDNHSELFAQQFLRDYRSAYRSFELVDIAAVDFQQAFDEQLIDIAYTQAPYLQKAIGEGYKIVYTSRQTPGLIFDVAVTRNQYIREHSEAISAFTQAWFSTNNWWVKYPDKGLKVIQRKLNLSTTPSLKGIKILDSKGIKDAFLNKNSPQNTAKALNKHLNFYKDKRLATFSTTVNDIIDTTFIESLAQ